jgi:hypothetical protein
MKIWPYGWWVAFSTTATRSIFMESSHANTMYAANAKSRPNPGQSLNL